MFFTNPQSTIFLRNFIYHYFKVQLISKCPSFWCLQIFQRRNEFFVRISALASRKRSNQNKIIQLVVKNALVFFLFVLFKRLGKKQVLARHQNDFLKLSDLYIEARKVAISNMINKCIGIFDLNRKLLPCRKTKQTKCCVQNQQIRRFRNCVNM